MFKIVYQIYYVHIIGFTDDREGGYKLGKDNKPYTTLAYTNGPGGYAEINETVRPDLTDIDTGNHTCYFF